MRTFSWVHFIMVYGNQLYAKNSKQVIILLPYKKTHIFFPSFALFFLHLLCYVAPSGATHASTLVNINKSHLWMKCPSHIWCWCIQNRVVTYWDAHHNFGYEPSPPFGNHRECLFTHSRVMILYQEFTLLLGCYNMYVI